MKSVVTGGCGFIGSHLVDRLVERGDDVVVVDDLATSDAAWLNPDADLTRGSVLDLEVLREAFDGTDRVFHLAALPRVERSIEDPAGTHRVNVGGTLNVLEAARGAGADRIVYASSSSVYGLQETHVMSEDMAPNPLSPYALQKLIGEQYLSMFAPVYGLTAVSLRYFNVYGPRQPAEGEYALVIGKFLEARRSGRPPTVYGDGEQTRAYTHVDDVVAATLLGAEVDVPAGRNTVLNVGSEVETSVNRIAAMIGGEVVHVVPNPRGEMEERRKAADWSRAASVLGWAPTIGIEEGLAALAEGICNAGFPPSETLA